MWGLLCYRRNYGAYPNLFCNVFPLGPDQFPLAVVEVEARRRQRYPGHMGWVQSVLLPKPGWLTSLYRHLLGKDQERLPLLARGNPWIDSLPRASTSNCLRVWLRCNSKQGDYDPTLPKRPKIFYLGLVGYPRPGTELLERGRWKNRQYKSKGVIIIIFKYLQDGFKMFPREQARKKRGEKLRKD